jgi:predicted nucleic acid-binding protein
LSLVLDASMAIAWLFEDERTEAAVAVLRRVAAEGAVVPSLWRLEIANVLEVAVRRGRCDRPHVDRSLGRLGALPITADEETDSRAWSETLTLAREAGLTLYDAAYLDLALRRRLALASRDAALVVAARERGVEVLGER